ncbi:MAG TPA: AraC family transcriptional regulator [Novosphingobium sp.]|nr:AraC family transcriptional regulator [Novosphingobium sp.]
MTHADLATQIARFTPEEGIFDTAIDRLTLVRWSQPSIPVHMVQRPALCLIAQGGKQVLVGDRLIAYGPASYLVASLDLPITGVVMEASADAPYLCFCLYLDGDALSELLVDLPAPAGAGADAEKGGLGLSLHPVTEAMVDAAMRLTALLGNPAEARVLAPLIERELLYRLVTGPMGAVMRSIAVGEGGMARIARAIGWLKANFRRPFSGPDLARVAGMSVSSFHDHFRRATAMTPLQYQKQLRLQEARRLMMTSRIAAAEAADRVGYESTSQFSREYRRLFGAPPLRDAAQLREAVAAPLAI